MQIQSWVRFESVRIRHVLKSITGGNTTGKVNIRACVQTELKIVCVRHCFYIHHHPGRYQRAKILFNPRSDEDAIQLFRQSIVIRQKDMLESSLKALEANMLTARPATNDEAQLRTQEAELVLKWIERAK